MNRFGSAIFGPAIIRHTARGHTLSRALHSSSREFFRGVCVQRGAFTRYTPGSHAQTAQSAQGFARPLGFFTIGSAPSNTAKNAAKSVQISAPFSTSAAVSHNHIHKPKEGEELHVTFISKDGSQQTFEVAEGENILDIAQSYNLDMEGACGGSCACSTCHVIIDPEFYDEIEEPDDDENDMLDLAFGLTETSRLGCQIKMTKELDGIRIALPAMTRNLQSRDFN